MVKVVPACMALAAALVAQSAAFVVPSTGTSALVARPVAAAASPLRMGLSDWVPGPIKGALSGGKKQAQRVKDEGAALFRQLGVASDATFEEIQEATARLKAKYAGDRKQQVRIDKLKDDIMDLRLRQRMAGTSAVSSGVLAAQEAERYLSRKAKGGGVKMPGWTRGLILLPDKEWAISAVYPFALFGTFGVVFPTASKLLIAVSAIFAASKMSTREAPPMEKNEMGQIGAITPPTKATVLLTLFATLAAGVTGVPLGAAMCSAFGQSVLIAESWRVAGIQIMFAFVSLFISTYRKK